MYVWVLHGWGKYAAHWCDGVTLVACYCEAKAGFDLWWWVRQSGSVVTMFYLTWSKVTIMLFSCSYVYFIFIKLKVRFHSCVSMLCYNCDSDIRTQESRSKFHTSKTFHTNILSPLGCLCCQFSVLCKEAQQILHETQISEMWSKFFNTFVTASDTW